MSGGLTRCLKYSTSGSLNIFPILRKFLDLLKSVGACRRSLACLFFSQTRKNVYSDLGLMTTSGGIIHTHKNLQLRMGSEKEDQHVEEVCMECRSWSTCS